MDKKYIAINGIIASLYIVITLINPLSFGIINIRIADFIPAIAIIDRKKAIGITVGMTTANLFSPFGLSDVGIALLICLFSFYGTVHIKDENVRIFLLAISTAILVSLEISFFTHIPFIFELSIMLITQILMCFVGATVYRKIDKIFKNT